jgi:PPOX class probable F420-dependent enzyme
MAKSRDAIRLAEGELPALYAECKSLQLATLDRQGAPHLTTVWYAVHEGAFLFETYGKSQKVVNMRRDPRVALLLEAGTEYSELRGVSMQGRAEIIDEYRERLRLMTVLVDHHFPGQSPEALAAMAARMAEKRTVISVKPDKVISWDHRKLGRKGP